jgi:hypothetical protein
MIASSFDYLLKVRTADIRRYRIVLGEKISSLPHVESTSTFVAMETVKESGADLSAPVPDAIAYLGTSAKSTHRLTDCLILPVSTGAPGAAEVAAGAGQAGPEFARPTERWAYRSIAAHAR